MVKKLDNPVQMAVIGAAHGTKGEVRIKSFTANPLSLADFGELTDKKGNRYKITDLRQQKHLLVVRLDGITDRNEAEALNGVSLYVDRSQLPDDLEEDEFYQTDLIGLEVHSLEGAVLGKVAALFDFGGGDLLELRLTGHKPVLIPFTRASVPQVSISGGFIVVNPVAAGLVEDEEEEEGAPI